MRPWRIGLILGLACLAVALLWQADTVLLAQTTPQRATHTPIPYATPAPTLTPAPPYPAPDHHVPTVRDGWEDFVESR